MPLWHSDQDKRKVTGGRKRAHRSKRRYEAGGYAAETVSGSTARKKRKGVGGVSKIKLLRAEFVNVTDPETGETKRAALIRVVSNPVNLDYDRRRVVTKGAVIETDFGNAVVTSRPGQHGVVNAVLTKESAP
jgi:small subunit ribosomal protein S8e